MSTNLDEIIDAAILLDEPSRFKLVTRLLETLPDEPPGLSGDDTELLTQLKRRTGDWEDAVPLSHLWQ